MRVDVHQHLWPDPFVAALRARREPPFVEGRGDRVVTHPLLEPPAPADLAVHRLDARLEGLDGDRVDLAVILPSSPLGAEALPAAEAMALLAPYHEGLLDLVARSGGRLAALAAAPLAEPDAGAGRVAGWLDAGCAGLSLPSEALGSPAGVDRCRPLLELLAERDAPLMVHPGPAPWSLADVVPAGLPGWWPSLAAYTGSMLRAFFTWRAAGAAAHPRVRVVFSVLAGGAPVLEGRFASFAGEAHPIDRNVFFDAASSRRPALELALATYGLDQVVLGTDVPVLDGGPVWEALEGLGPPVVEAVAGRNALRLLRPATVAA